MGRRDPARDWAGSCVRLLRGGRAERVAAPPAAAAAPPAAAAPHSGGPHSRSSPGPPPPPTPPPAPATPAAVAALRLRRHATLSRGVGGGREGLARQELEAMGQRPEARGQGWGRGLGARAAAPGGGHALRVRLVGSREGAEGAVHAILLCGTEPTELPEQCAREGGVSVPQLLQQDARCIILHHHHHHHYYYCSRGSCSRRLSRRASSPSRSRFESLVSRPSLADTCSRLEV